MKLKKWLIGIGLLTSFASVNVYYVVTAINHQINISQKPTQKINIEPRDAQITLATVFGSIATFTLNNGSAPTNVEAIAYLNSKVVGGQYADVINDIKIDSIGGGQVLFSALPKSRKYTGSSSFNYSSNTLMDLAEMFIKFGDDLSTSGNWDDQPTNKTFLETIQRVLNPQLDVNQINVNIQSDANSLSGLKYGVEISAKANSTLYEGSAVIKYSLNDNRKALSADFMVGTSTPFEWAQFSSSDQNKPSILNTICQANNVDAQTISAYNYTLTYDTSDNKITLEVSNNPYYKDGNISFKYKIVTEQPFTWNWDEIQDPNKGNGVGWSYATIGKGGFTFIPIDITNHTVYIIDAYGYSGSGITSRLEADNMIIGSQITDPNNRQVWTITGLAGRDDATNLESDAGTFIGDVNLTGSITLPSTIKYIGKNAFRNCSNITSLNLNEGLETLYGHSCMTIGCNSLRSISIPSTLSNLSEYMFSGSNLTDIYLYRSTHIYSQLVYQSAATPFYSISQYTSSNPRTGRIHVPSNLCNEYINSSVWQQQNWIGTKTGDPAFYTRQVFQPIQKLSDVVGNTINLPAYATIDSMLTLLCYINNIDPDKIKNYAHSISGYTENGGGPGTMTIKVVNNPYYYGSADVYWTKNSFSTFYLTSSELNGNGGWNGYTAGNMCFWIVDPINKYVEFNQGGNCGGTKLEGTDVTIGNTITYQGVTYNVLGTYNSGSEQNGLRNGEFSGSITIGNQIKILDRCSFRKLTNITSFNFEPNSTLVEFGGCTTMDMPLVTTWDIPASVKTIQYGNFGSQDVNNESALRITFWGSSMYPYLSANGSGRSSIFFASKHLNDHTLRIFVQPELVNQYRNDPDWQTACGGLDNAIKMILPIAPSLTPNMTSSSQDGYTTSTSSENDAPQWKPWHAFDGITNDPNSAWATAGNTIKTGWLRIEMPSSKKLVSYQISPSFHSSFQISSPKTWTFQGSNDGSSWTDLDSRTNISDWDATQESSKTFYISNFEANASYKYYRINVTANNGGNFLLISELKLFGY